MTGSVVDFLLHGSKFRTIFNGMKNAINKAATKNFHVLLPEQFYRRVKETAQRQKKPATKLVKEALEYWLDEHDKLALHEDIARYASATAGTGDDLDETLEAAGLEQLACGEHNR